MKNKNYIFTLLFFFLFSSACGFKIIDQTNMSIIKIKEINISGDKKINYHIKNNLNNYFSFSEKNNPLIIKITTEKTKSIKEKNIKNQITKYEITVKSIINLNFINQNLLKDFTISVNGPYIVSSAHTSTLTNKNNLEKYLADQISEKIRNKIILILNDI